MTWDHRPERPTWRCAKDGLPWPCDVAKGDLRARHGNRGELAQTMVGFLQDAAGDNPDATAGQLWHQLLAWTQHD
jgi:hypothetical protein